MERGASPVPAERSAVPRQSSEAGLNAFDGGLNPALEAAFSAITRVREEIALLPGAGTADARVEMATAADIVESLAETLERDIEVLKRLRDALGGPVLTAFSGAPLGADDFAGQIVSVIERIEQSEGVVRDISATLAAHRCDLAAVLADPLPMPPDNEPMPEREVFDRAVVAATRCALESERRLAVLLAGVDHCAELGRTHGQPVADDVAAAAGRMLVDCVGDLGIVYRHGPEAFAVLLPDSNLRQAVAVAEHLRRAAAGQQMVVAGLAEEALGRLSLSLGVAALSDDDNPATLMARAAGCLSEAQWSGGNRVICETDPDFEQDLRRSR
ncbi:diguanylate cyclase [Pseudoxanthobacter sp.]|uniref:GGDEF domain-containing protein n=1 Tax=Pseudoxanthobacter sp. TaxID=1925742 RepID=UPI002FE0B163